MRWTILAPAVSLAAMLAAPASAALSDFRLPEPSTNQPEPERQGPVAPDVPESRRPPPTPAPAATRAPTPTPTPTPTIVVPDLTDAEPRAAPRATRTPAATPLPAAEAAPPPIVGAPSPVGTGQPDRAADAAPSALPAAPIAAETASPDTEGGFPWLWIVAALAALGALAFARWRVWQQRGGSRPVVTPQIERPRPAPAAAVPAAPPPSPAAAAPVPADPLQVALEPLRLSLTLMNATLAYRLEVANRGLAPIADLRIGADMIAAHASMTREQQLSGPGAGAATVQRIDRLEPGESRIVEGEFRVPFTQIVPIRQGNAALLLPLARFRLEAAGAAPVVRTFAVGQPGANAALQPFRLDLGPRVYPTLAQHAFA